MNEELSSYHKKFLIELIKSRGKLDSYRLFRRLKCSFSDFSKMHRLLEDRSLIRFDEHNSVRITPEGRVIVMKISDHGKISPPWKEIPSEFKRTHLTAESLYVPNTSKLDKKAFKI